MLFVDGALIETRLYHGARLPSYSPDLDDLRQHLNEDGWVEDVEAGAPQKL